MAKKTATPGKNVSPEFIEKQREELRKRNAELAGQGKPPGVGSGPATERAVNKAPEERPAPWVLKSSDPFAPEIIEAWALLAERAGVNRAKVTRARQDARELRAWQAANPDQVKLPD